MGPETIDTKLQSKAEQEVYAHSAIALPFQVLAMGATTHRIYLDLRGFGMVLCIMLRTSPALAMGKMG